MSRRAPRRVLALALLTLSSTPVLSSRRAAADDAPPVVAPAPAAPPPSEVPPPAPASKSPKPPPPPNVPPLPTVLHVPTDELDVLLKAQGRAVLLHYDEYRALLDAARTKEVDPRAALPQDVVRLSGDGTLDLTDDQAARFRIVYRIQGLAPGPRSVGFDSGGAAFESVKVEPEGSAGPGRYEARDGHGRLYLDGPGVRRVTVEGSAVPIPWNPGRRLDLWLPNPAAMALAVTLPPGVEATIAGEGVPLVVQTPADKPVTVVTRPTRGGHLELAWASSAQGTEGPGVIDADVKTLFTVGEGTVTVRAVVRADVLRTPTDTLTLEIPADLAVHSVEGAGVTGFTRSDDRLRLIVRREKPALGRLEVLLQGERPYKAGPGVELPRVRVAGALRHQGEAALRFGPDVNPRAVRVAGGRRVAERAQDPATAGVLRYALSGADAGLALDVEPGALRVDATSTYYLNLAEPGQTLFASVTYRVVEGTLFRMSPRFPREYDLKEMTVNGAPGGFTRDVTADGVVEITLAKGVPVGGDVVLLAMLERARADWVPEKGHVQVPFPVPSAGATREEGYVAIGADAGFEVLDAGAKDLAAVGAADLTARGLAAAGLVYGYRVDGAAPSVALDVSRRDPLIEADVVTVLHPGPRRVDLSAQAVYRIQRAGVRRLFLDLPSWAGDQVDVWAPYLRSATRLAGDRRPADVPEGYDRWQVDLEQRAIGTQVVTASWFLDRDTDDWSIEADRRLAARVPLERAERLLVVRRSAGLEVSVPRLAATPDVRVLDLTELPPEATVDPQGVLEVLRLPQARDGVAVDVRKHAGAAVLGAIATEVSIRTAVAREGILRTRAEVTLYNVDRQFVDVALPPHSTLLGAVVNGLPVKPLVRPEGTLLLTVPSTVSSGPSRTGRAVVALSYETRLGESVESRVRVEAPRFPGLEVLHTTQEVGVEPELTITAVGGDLLASAPVVRPTRTPWLAWPLESMSLAKGRILERAVPTSSAAAGMEDAPAEGYGVGGKRPQGKSRSAAAGSRPGAGPAGAVPPGLREPSDGASTPPATATTPAPMPAMQGPEPAPPMPVPVAPTPGEPAMGDDTYGGLGYKPGSDPGAAVPGGAPGQPPSGGTPLGESGRPGGPFDASRAGMARKGQLSLDVPVFLAPNRVLSTRIGGGGSLVLDLASKDGSERAYLLLGLAALAAGLAVVALGWLSAGLAVLAGLAVAGILQLVFGASASTLVAAVADGTTLLALLLALRWIFTRRGARAPHAPAAAGPVVALLGAALGLGGALLLAVSSAAPARADDAPAPTPEPPAPIAAPGGDAVIAPEDEIRGGALAPDDRVFVPLAKWLELERKAHPEHDPELAALGQIVTLVEAAYHVDVGATNAQGSARLVFALRGRGMQLVALPLAGFAVTEARLDGQPVRLLLDTHTYRLPLEGEGDHVLELAFQVPLLVLPSARTFSFSAPTFAGSTFDVSAGAFDGDLRVSGAGRVVVLTKPEEGTGFTARAFLGRPVLGGPEHAVRVSLVDRSPTALLAAVKTRAESRIVHSLRDGGTESVLALDVHVLQGQAPFVELAVPEGVDVLEASGPQVKRWETGPGRLRLVLAQPTEGKVSVRVRVFRPAASPERRETLPELPVLQTTGESGVVVVNGDPTLRLDPEPGTGLFRTARPADADAAGPDGQGRVLGAWRFAARPAALAVRAERTQARLELYSVLRATVGDDRLRTVLEGRVGVQRAPVGDLAFTLPGTDEVRAVEGPGIQSWWLDGQGDARRLFVRMSDLFEGDRAVTVRLERRLGGTRQDVALPRWALVGAQVDQGLLFLFALPDVEPLPAAGPGWKALAPTRLEGQAPNVVGARATHAFEWDTPPAGALKVALRAPDQEVEAVVVTQISPSDEEQRLEHLVLFDVRRGAAERLSLFVPDGGRGYAANDVVRARDLRELRWEPAVRTDADGKEVKGRLYALRLQSAKSGLIEVTVSQLWPADSIVHVVRPEGVKATRWFAIVRTFLDGEVDVRVAGGAPDPSEWAELPFLPNGLERSSVLRTFAARAPYLLQVSARRHRIEAQADAVVLAARAEVVVGLDGEARVRGRYRLFNRARQFLALRLPEGAVLYGAVAADRPVKPLAGPDGSLLLPVPKVPLGGAGYEVSITYRARAGSGLERGGSATLLLPQVLGVEVDRTVITLRVPSGFDYDFDTKMTAATEAEALGDEVEASLREAQEVLKVAETGTLEQRLFACANATPLVDQARVRLEQYRAQGAAGDRVAALRADLDKLAQVQAETSTRCQVDAGVAKNKAQFEANETYGANANGQALVILDLDREGAHAGDAGRASRDAEALAAGANWRFNGEVVSTEKTEKKDIAELKGRMQSELERRGDEERRKSVDVAQEERSRADASKVAAKEMAKQEAAPDDATVRYDENRNNLLLNDRLRRVQTVQRQLGTDAGGAGGGAGGGVVAAPPRSGGATGAADDLQDRAEAALQRVGLMGVDVPLPKEGRVFWFVGARAGSALEIDASPAGAPAWQRALLGLGLFGALGYVLVRVARRRVAVQA